MSEQAPPFPNTVDAIMSVVKAGWDADVARRPHGQHTTVVVHVDLESRVAALHLGPLLSDADRQYLTCDATCEVWFERDGQVIGSGRETRQISRRLRRALEHRDRCCVVPGCGATRGLHAHHVIHWGDGGLTELENLVLVCPTITGPITAGSSPSPDPPRISSSPTARTTHEFGSLARPPTTPPPDVPPCKGPTGERADWWWYTPYQPKPPPIDQLAWSPPVIAGNGLKQQNVWGVDKFVRDMHRRWSRSPCHHAVQARMRTNVHAYGRRW